MNTRLDTAAIPGRFRSILLLDRVLLTLLAGMALLWILDPVQVVPSVLFLIDSIVHILPFLLVAVGLSAFAGATGADGLIARAFAGSPVRSVFLAAAAGTLSPFCSCGVIPVIAALLRARVPLAPVMAFWIASPIMDPEMFILTAAGIGLEFALVKTFATLLMGLLAGYAVHLFSDRSGFANPLRKGGENGCAADPFESRVQWRFWRSRVRLERLYTELRSTLLFLGKWLLLAFFLESLMTAYIPADLISGWFGTGAWHEVPIAAVAGIPAYLNGYAAIPLVAGLMDLGMNPGAALAFMTAGAVSSVPAAMAVAVIVKRAVFAAYLALGLAGSTATGVLYALS